MAAKPPFPPLEHRRAKRRKHNSRSPPKALFFFFCFCLTTVTLISHRRSLETSRKAKKREDQSWQTFPAAFGPDPDEAGDEDEQLADRDRERDGRSLQGSAPRVTAS